MATFGDELGIVEYGSSGYETTTGLQTATMVGDDPVASDLCVAFHFSGSGSVDVTTAGFTTDCTLTDDDASDLGNDDQGKIYSKKGVKAVTCESTSSDTHMLIVVVVQGPFADSPFDVTADSDANATDPSVTGNTLSTAQADEYLVGIDCMRVDHFDYDPSTEAFTRTGTAEPVSPGVLAKYTDSSVYETRDDLKMMEAAFQVLTTQGTAGFSRIWRDVDVNFSMVGVAAYKKEAGGATGQPTMRRWGGVPHMTPGNRLQGRAW